MAGSEFGGQSREEIHEWMTVNRRLRRHGLPSFRILPSQDINISSDRYVCMDLESSQSMRLSVSSLMSEIDRMEKIVQDVEQANSELRDEVAHLTGETEMLCAKSKDIKVMLECSRARVQELEQERGKSASQISDNGEKFNKIKSTMAAKCQHLEAKVAEQEKELSRLRREVIIVAQENERRNKRQHQAIVDSKKRTLRAHSSMDEKVDENSFWLDKDGRTMEQTNGSKDIVESYEKQLQDRNKKIRSLEQERDTIKQDLRSRPELKDYRLLTQRVKKLESLLSQHNVSVPGEKAKMDPFSSKRKLSAKLADLDSLPVEDCHHYLRELCAELETDDLQSLANLVRDLKENQRNCNRFQEYCRQLSEIVECLNEKSQRSRSYGTNRDLTTLLCDSNMRYYLGVVENWSTDISSLGELQTAINHLLDKVVPWIRARMDHDHSVADMVELIERVTHADKSDRKVTLMEDISRSDLEGIVSHFQTLFDVPMTSGIFPRMNEIYRTLGESKNVQNTLRNILGVRGASTTALVDAVGKLCHMYNSTTAEQLKKLMQTDDLNSVIKRLHEHKEFFPAFKTVIDRLFDVLGVSQMCDIVPAVRALKLLAS